ncbi:hypothetical protein HDU96_010728 [Phlyctochytrium bullatum]|nr:hypothetical protein HDU96_010728 [Phlyctochytrium bullatum]
MRPLRLATANVQGLREKTRFVYDLIRKKNLDFVAVQETLLDPIDNLRDDYQRATILEARKTKGQGGLAVIRNTQSTAPEDFVLIARDAENADYLWFLYRAKVMVGVFYIPPPSANSDIHRFRKALASIDRYANPRQHPGPVVILGDFNCRLGHITNDHESSPSQRRWALVDATARAGLWILTARPNAEPWTYITKMATAQVGKSVIDLIAISQDLQPRKKFVTVVKDAGIPSPHLPVMAELQVPDLPLPSPLKLRTVFKTDRLKSKTVLKRYSDEAEAQRDEMESAIREALSPITEAQLEGAELLTARAKEAVETAYSLVTATINAIATDILGTRTVGARKFDDIWDGDLAQMKKEAQQAHRARARAIEAPEELRKQLQAAYRAAKKAFGREVRARRRKGYKAWTQSLHEANNSEIDKITAAVRKARARRVTASQLSSQPEKLEEYRRHFAKITKPKGENCTDDPLPVPPIREEMVTWLEGWVDITAKDVLEAMKATPVRKAPRLPPDPTASGWN